MRRNKKIERCVDIRNTMAYVQYDDGSFGYELTRNVPAELREKCYAEKRAESTIR